MDNPWRYAGLKRPKSMIIPKWLSKRLPFRPAIDMMEQGLQERDYAESKKMAISSLAENLANANISYTRCWFPWGYFEPTVKSESELGRLLDESYTEWPMDDFVDNLTNRGVAIVPVLVCGYQRFLPADLRIDSNKDLCLKRASVHARLLVRRYKDKIRYWQIENEPNWWKAHVVGGWREGMTWLNPGDFTFQLLKELNAAVHTEDPKAQTIVNLEGDRLSNTSHFAAHCDLLGLDFYPSYKHAYPIDTSIFARAKEVAEKSGKPVIISETGYPSGPVFRGYTRDRQAEYIFKACTEAFGLEALSGVGIWRYMDSTWRSFPRVENHFGLIDRQGRPKPAWSALAEMARRLT